MPVGGGNVLFVFMTWTFTDSFLYEVGLILYLCISLLNQIDAAPSDETCVVEPPFCFLRKGHSIAVSDTSEM